MLKLMKVMMDENRFAITGPCDSNSGYQGIVPGDRLSRPTIAAKEKGVGDGSHLIPVM
jgi:hypothetical protein